MDDRSQAKLRLELHCQFRQAVELVEKVPRCIPAPFARMMVLRLEGQREGRLVLLAFTSVLLRLRFGQDASGKVSVFESARVAAQNVTQITFCELHPFAKRVVAALASVILQPLHELAMRDDFLGLVANRASVPRVADSKVGPGLGKGRAAVGFVGAAF